MNKYASLCISYSVNYGGNVGSRTYNPDDLLTGIVTVPAVEGSTTGAYREAAVRLLSKWHEVPESFIVVSNTIFLGFDVVFFNIPEEYQMIEYR